MRTLFKVIDIICQLVYTVPSPVVRSPISRRAGVHCKCRHLPGSRHILLQEEYGGRAPDDYHAREHILLLFNESAAKTT